MHATHGPKEFQEILVHLRQFQVIQQMLFDSLKAKTPVNWLLVKTSEVDIPYRGICSFSRVN